MPNVERAAAEGSSIQRLLSSVAGYVSKLPRGERAQLRRLRADRADMPPEVFWRIVARYEVSIRDEAFWLHVVPLMVEHEHRPGVRAGQALAKAGVAEGRVERWLRGNRSTAWKEARRLLSKLDGGFDWAGYGALLFYWNEKARKGFAREFFLANYRQTPDDSDGDE